MKGMS